MALVAGSLLAAAAPAAAQTAPATVRIGSIAIDASGESYYGVESGIFASNGINAQVTTSNTGAAILTAVLAGDLDVGIANPLQIASAIARGIPLQMLAPAALYSLKDANANLVVAKDSPFKTPKDLVGATFGVSSLADFNQLSLLGIPRHEQRAEGQRQFVELPFSQVGAALQRGTIGAAVITEPFKSDAIRAGQIREFGDTYLTIAARDRTDLLVHDEEPGSRRTPSWRRNSSPRSSRRRAGRTRTRKSRARSWPRSRRWSRLVVGHDEAPVLRDVQRQEVYREHALAGVEVRDAAAAGDVRRIQRVLGPGFTFRRRPFRGW